MKEKIDIIAALGSGVPHAFSIYERKLKEGHDVRFIPFYPIKLTPLNFALLRKKNEVYIPELDSAEIKFHMFGSGLHERISRFFQEIENLNDDEIEQKAIKLGSVSPSFARFPLIENKWDKIRSDDDDFLKLRDYLEKFLNDGNKTIKHQINLTTKFYEKRTGVLFPHFVCNPQNRFIGIPDISRTAIVCDDFHNYGNTINYSIYSLFQLGYTKIEMSIHDDDVYEGLEGDINYFQDILSKPDILNITKSIVRRAYFPN